MYGTLAGALSARHIEFDRERFEANVEGTIEGVGKTIRITAITVHYRIHANPSDRVKINRALAAHGRGCPAHESVKEAIKITWDAVISPS